jgi:hypothetical protein
LVAIGGHLGVAVVETIPNFFKKRSEEIFEGWPENLYSLY